jgi:hypothetical protein
LLLILCCALSACRKKDKCECITCQNGNECNEGKCGCPEGKVKLGEQCRALEKNEYYSTIRCRCLDTFSISIDLDLPINSADTTEKRVNFTNKIANSNNLVHIGTNGNYYKKAEGDSLYVLQLTNILGDECDLKGVLSYASFKGKIVSNNGKKELRGKILWWSSSPYIFTDSCSVVLHQ